MENFAQRKMNFVFFFAHEIFAYMKGMLKVSASAILSSFFCVLNEENYSTVFLNLPPGGKARDKTWKR